MSPRKLSTILAVIFVGCVVTVVAIGVASAIERGDLSFPRAIPGVIIFAIWIGIALRLGKGIIRGSNVERWFGVLASAAIATGVYVNSGPQPAVILVAIGIASGLCAIGLLTPFVGRHFSKKSLAEQGDDAN